MGGRTCRLLKKLDEIDNERLVKMMYEGEVEGRQSSGRPCKRWTDIGIVNHAAHNFIS